MKNNLSTMCLCLVLATWLTACSTVTTPHNLDVELESLEPLAIGQANYTFAPMNKGHAYYDIEVGADFENAARGITKFRVSGDTSNSSAKHSAWISVSDFESGKVALILNTGFEPQKCSGGSISSIPLEVETDTGKKFQLDFNAPNGCEISFYNFISK
jgi:hypothetical protein